MSNRIRLTVLALLAVLLFWGGARKAASRQDNAPKQTLVINYPNRGVVVSGGGAAATRYQGLIYVKVFPVSPDLVKKHGTGPVAAAELTASQRDVRSLPLGEYEVHFAMRTGGELKTFIVRNVILRADRATSLIVEMNAEAKTTIIGGDMTAQQMADTIRQLQKEVADLKQQLADAKKR